MSSEKTTRIVCLVVGNVLVLGCAFGCFYWLAPKLLRVFGISEYAQGASVAGLLAICIGCFLIGGIVGLLLIPVVLRPLVAPSAYWRWVANEPTLNVPIVSPCLSRWSEMAFGKPPKGPA